MEGITTTRIAAWGAALALVTGGVIGATTAAASPARQDEATTSRTTTQESTQKSTQEPAQRSQVRAGGVSTAVAYPQTTARWAGSVNIYSRTAVNTAYWRNYGGGLVTPTGYTGDDSRCERGSQSSTSRATTLRAINYVRSLAGLAPVSFSSTLNARSQLTAVMMSANKKLSHYPTSSWRCYSLTAARNAARSNLALGYPEITSAGLVSMYMRDAGSTNTAVGHRRWLMNPFTTYMGSGATDTANSITVIGPSSNYRPNPAWVSWPTRGQFPNSLEPSGRWSLSAGNKRINFRYASVRVYRNGTLLRTVKQPVKTGYAMPTIVWEMPDAVARSGTFRVVVSGIRKAGTTKRYTRSYYVTMFTPTR